MTDADLLRNVNPPRPSDRLTGTGTGTGDAPPGRTLPRLVAQSHGTPDARPRARRSGHPSHPSRRHD